MMNVETYREHAADCLRQAEAEAAPEDKNILLNVALAWVRLAHQVQEVGQEVGREVGVVGAGAAGAAAVVAAAGAADAAEAVDVQDTPDETVETVETDEAEAETAEADRKPTTRMDQFQHDVEKVLFAH
jgi:threonine dehydrogenase-like Zn-dependent dehydrogenase